MDTTYDGMEQVASLTNPYPMGSTSGSTGTAYYFYDGLSRKTLQEQPDGTFLQSCYDGIGANDPSYPPGPSGPNTCPSNGGSLTESWVDSFDETGRHWLHVTDALNRLLTTFEPNPFNVPTVETDYQYDALGDLTRVDQWGGIYGSTSPGDRVRISTYNSLSELLTATNPESGTTSYGYDNDGNVRTKTDQRQITTTATYDALNRATQVTYSDGTPSACYLFGTATNEGSVTNAIGRLIAEWTQAGSCATGVTAPPSTAVTSRIINGYDPLGRVLSDSQCPLGPCANPYTFPYTYDLAGKLTSSTRGIPSSPILTYAYDAAERMSTVSSSVSDTNDPGILFQNPQYGPFGLLSAQLAVDTSTSQPALSTLRGYDIRGRTTSETDASYLATGGTTSTGTIGIGLNEQVYATSGTPSTGTLTITGSENDSSSGEIIVVGQNPATGVNNAWNYVTNYGPQVAEPETLAASLASAVNKSCSGLVSASSNGGTTVTLTALALGAASDFGITISGGHNTQFASPSFTLTPSGSAMSGGSSTEYATGTITVAGLEQSMTSGSTVTYDTGTLVAIVEDGQGTCAGSTGYGQAEYGEVSTPASIAAAWAGEINSDPTAIVSVSANNNALTFTSKALGAQTNYVVQAFFETGISFSVSSLYTDLAGGTTTQAVYDSGTVSATAFGVTSTVPWNSSSTSTSVASTLAAAMTSANSSLTATANGGTIQLISKGTGTAQNVPVTVSITNNSTYFETSSLRASATAMTGAENLGTPLGTVYQYQVQTSAGTTGYAPNGDLLAIKDSVMGQWSYTYDQVNRVTNASSTSGAYNGTSIVWTYDPFGNRKSETPSVALGYSVSQPLPPTFTANYTTNNQMQSITYDPLGSGNVVQDNLNKYFYDGAGRLCGVMNLLTTTMTQYIYDAEGNRVAKGNPTTKSCASGNGFAGSALYLLDLGGEQVTELNTSSGSMQPVHSNVFAGGKLLATWDAATSTNPAGTHFHFTDMIGTRRIQTSAQGALELTCVSLPFGNGLSCVQPPNSTAVDATEHHFTGKERDTESGNDFFMARYYSSTNGVFLTPDWSTKPEGVPYADITNPQSLNLYAYVQNNPLTREDPNGHKQLGNPRSSSGHEACRIAGGTACSDHDAAVKKIEEAAARSLANQLAASEKAKAAAQQQTAQGLAGQVPGAVKTAIMNSVNASNSPCAAGSPCAGDTTGGYHEEGGIAGTNASGGLVISPAIPGSASHSGTVNENLMPVDPSLNASMTNETVSWHVHPSGQGWVQTPSAQDQSVAATENQAVPGLIHIVVGAGNRTVYFYDGSKNVPHMSLKQFMGTQ